MGVFMPIVKLPIVGQVNYFYNGRAMASSSYCLRSYHWS